MGTTYRYLCGFGLAPSPSNRNRADRGLAVEPASTEKPDPVVSTEIRQRTAQAFTRLRPGLRVAATLAVIEQRPYKEVAEALEISVAAVKVRVFRALRLLRKDLKKQGITS